MIGDVFFFLRTLLITFALVMLLQIKVGDSTIEQRAYVWAQNSPAVEMIQSVAAGGVHALTGVYQKMISLFDRSFAKKVDPNQVPGMRSLGVQLKRSEEYARTQAEKVKAAAIQSSEMIDFDADSSEPEQ